MPSAPNDRRPAPVPKQPFALSVDSLGTWASALCVVHCLLTPVVLSFSAVLVHLFPSEERIHRSLAILIAALGIIAVVRGFRRHRRWSVLLLATFGLASIWGTAYWGDSLPSHAVEVALTALGSGAMIAAHRLNHTFCANCLCSRPDTQVDA